MINIEYQDKTDVKYFCILKFSLNNIYFSTWHVFVVLKL